MFFFVCCLAIFAFIGFHQARSGINAIGQVVPAKNWDNKPELNPIDKALWAATPIWIKQNSLSDLLKVGQGYRVVLCKQVAAVENVSNVNPCFILMIAPIKLQGYVMANPNNDLEPSKLLMIWVKTPFSTSKSWLKLFWQNRKIFDLIWLNPIDVKKGHRTKRSKIEWLKT